MTELELANLAPCVLNPTFALSPNLTEFADIVVDHRKLAGLPNSQNAIFCAIKGISFDGHEVLDQVKSHCGLILVEQPLRSIANLGPTPVLQVKSTRCAWAQIESLFYQHPSRDLVMIGTTGTNGKTSTTWMAKDLMDFLGFKTASMGTLGCYVGSNHIETTHTTPDPDQLYALLRLFVDQGVRYVFMEVSSHSLVQQKVAPIRFAAASFTSFSQDHLDFHVTMDSYLEAKLQLFDYHMAPHALCLFNGSLLGHERIKKWTQLSNSKTKNSQSDRRELEVKTYGLNSNKTDFLYDFSVLSRSAFHIGQSQVEVTQTATGQFLQNSIPMLGSFFCENFAAAIIMISHVTKMSLVELHRRIQGHEITPVPGRLELVQTNLKPWRPKVYVDEAHSPDALKKSISALKPFNTPLGDKRPAIVDFKHETVTTIFGCGGNRDHLKRPLMGQIAALLSDRVVITDDNPRNESSAEIIKQILDGLPVSSQVDHVAHVTVESDRSQAIARTVTRAKGRSIVLIAGKGDESFQIVGTKKIPFKDRDHALTALNTPKNWLVLGGGVSGFAAARFLHQHHEKVMMYDDRPLQPPEDLATMIGFLSPQAAISWPTVGGIVVSPGVSFEHPVVLTARDLDLDIVTEIDLGFDRYQGHIIGVTGTNGKSTVVKMIEFLLRHANQDAVACGNIGTPPTSLRLKDCRVEHCAVVELSSYQMEGTRPWPSVGGIITSFSTDHLARHKTMEEYFFAKWALTSWLVDTSLFIVSADVAKWADKFGAKWPRCETIILSADKPPLPLDLSGLHIRGTHNELNAWASILMVQHVLKLLKVSWSPELWTALRHFSYLPYRCSVVFDDGHRRVINDSKSTNMESTLAALSLMERPTLLLMGGQGKGESYGALHQVVEGGDHRLKKLITFGYSRFEILRDAPANLRGEAFLTMNDAVQAALELAQVHQWDIIFSPGCASFDEFKNFEERGARFNAIVANSAKIN